ncbi:MAG: AAA family ATPase [Betaproteobacteria bacterium]
MKVINLFAGPGAGKSTTAAALFASMKRAGHKVELVTEYAKELTWDGRANVLEDSLYVLAKQNRKLSRLAGQVDYVVTDSPLPISLAYGYGAGKVPWFEDAVISLFGNYDNVNFKLERVKPYSKYGRSQSEAEAKVLDKDIEGILVKHKLPYTAVIGDDFADKVIYSRIFK